MPRKSRIDAPGALHHVMVRGIERRSIFLDDVDRDRFLERLALVLDATGASSLAWALIPNHFHLLLKTGRDPLATVMRRLLTGYAVSFNRRHRRTGHLFQNRYKSILCQEDVYLKELVRYIHLNPLHSGLVADLNGLDRYAYSGHSALMGGADRGWHATGTVLALFGRKLRAARKSYRSFVEQGMGEGRRADLTGGGLRRSVDGWSQVRALLRAKVFHKSDERILGDSDFVEDVLAAVADRTALDPAAIVSHSRERKKVAA
jgi:REP element-mobilizing transposase RayT